MWVSESDTNVLVWWDWNDVEAEQKEGKKNRSRKTHAMALRDGKYCPGIQFWDCIVWIAKHFVWGLCCPFVLIRCVSMNFRTTWVLQGSPSSLLTNPSFEFIAWCSSGSRASLHAHPPAGWAKWGICEKERERWHWLAGRRIWCSQVIKPI